MYFYSDNGSANTSNVWKASAARLRSCGVGPGVVLRRRGGSKTSAILIAKDKSDILGFQKQIKYSGSTIQMMGTNKFYARSKIWLEDADGKVVFGTGRYKIFKAIRTCGSINAAARELKMGYPAIWARVKATERRLGRSLLTRKAGGSGGGGSELTPLALELLERYEKINVCIEKKTDLLFEESLGSCLPINPKGG